MPTELVTLLRRDHTDFDRAMADIARPRLSPRDLSDTLDGVRLGMIAHSEAEEAVLSAVLTQLPQTSNLHLTLARMRADHLEQERALSALIVSRPGSQQWRDRAEAMRGLLREHGRSEEHQFAMLRNELAPELYAQLAGMFATERMRQFALIQPSSPIVCYAALAAG